MSDDSPKKPSKVNQRRASRRKPRGYVKLECRKGALGLGANVATAIMDVSETGARLVVSVELPAQQQVEVVLTCQGIKDPIKRAAKVCWQLQLDDGKFCIGVQFDKRIDYVDWQKLAAPT